MILKPSSLAVIEKWLGIFLLLGFAAVSFYAWQRKLKGFRASRDAFYDVLTKREQRSNAKLDYGRSVQLGVEEADPDEG